MYALNKLVSTEISFVKSAWSALFEISEMSDALFAFTHLITRFISFFEMREFDDTVKDMNESEMLLMSVTILACVTWKMLGKEMLDHLDDVEQYYRWW